MSNRFCQSLLHPCVCVYNLDTPIAYFKLYSLQTFYPLQATPYSSSIPGCAQPAVCNDVTHHLTTTPHLITPHHTATHQLVCKILYQAWPLPVLNVKFSECKLHIKTYQYQYQYHHQSSISTRIVPILVSVPAQYQYQNSTSISISVIQCSIVFLSNIYHVTFGPTVCGDVTHTHHLITTPHPPPIVAMSDGDTDYGISLKIESFPPL